MNKNRKKGLQITIAFHLLLLVILLLSNFPVPEPVFPDPDGIQINFGDSEDGAGDAEPQGEETETAETEAVEETENISEPVPPETVESSPTESVQENLTQDFQDAPSIEEKRKKEAQKKINEQKRIEKEKQRAEEKRIAEEKARVEKEKREKQERIDAIKNRAKNAFGKSNTASNGQGTTTGNKNQGGKNGDVNSQHTKGIGNGNGVSYQLKGRSSVSLHSPKSEVQSEGVVVVEIIVNRNGEVVEARPGVVGSTTTDGRLYDIAKKAALKTKFNIDESAADRQKGTIRYVFELH